MDAVTEREAGARGVDLRDVERFLYHEARCLDDPARWDEWIELFADDGVYWIPYSREQQDDLDTPSIVREDKVLLSVRFGRLRHPNAWAQDPATRACRLVGNVMVDGRDPGTGDLVVRSTFQMLEFRADKTIAYGGWAEHRLVAGGPAGFRIRRKRVDLVSGDGIYEEIMQALP